MPTPYFKTELGELYCGDFVELIKDIPDASVDCIYTDPPYEKRYANLYKSLADNSARILKRGGSLMTICPHYLLPTVIGYFNNSGLKYRWISAMIQVTGQHPRMNMGVEVCWKPILWYVKEAYPSGRGFLKDIVEIKQPKKLHKWQQDESWASYYLPRLCPKDGLMLDPMICTGTTAIICERLGIRWIGVDISKECCDIAVARLKG